MLKRFPLRLVPRVVGRPAFLSTLKGQALEDTIAEMNREMEDLFGGAPQGDLNPASCMSGSPNAYSFDAPPSSSPNPVATFSTTSGTPARAALLDAISTATAELQTHAFCPERTAKLAGCIGECARAIAALDQLSAEAEANTTHEPARPSWAP